MDPYRTLGVTRGCSHQEAKVAFRAKAWELHPDRGGDTQAFIELDEAYKSILRELDLIARNRDDTSKAASSTGPGRHSPEVWDAGIIVLGTAPGTPRSPRPPDPDWEPEIVLLDRPPTPFDPCWEPEIVLLDEPPSQERPDNSNRAEDIVEPWFRQVPLRRKAERTGHQISPGRTVLMVSFVVLIFIVLLGLAVVGRP